MSDESPGPVTDEDRELVAGAVRAAQRYDYDYRPKGRGWARVPDEQAARLLLGALGALEPKPPETPYLDAPSDALTRKVTEAEAERDHLRALLDTITTLLHDTGIPQNQAAANEARVSGKLEVLS